MRTRQPTRRVPCWVGVLACAALVSCGQQPGTTGDPVASDAPTASPRELEAIWSGDEGDSGTPDKTPHEVFDEAVISVTGAVADVGLGSIERLGPDDPFAADRLAVEIDIDGVEKGSDLVEAGDTIWMEILVGPDGVAMARDTIPVGLPVALLAEPTWPSTRDFPLDRSEAVYPPGTETWTPTDPQGLAFLYGGDEGVSLPVNDEKDASGQLDEYADPS